MQVILTHRARNDLLNLFDYNTKISINYAIKTNNKILSYIEELKYFPYIGRYVPEIQDKFFRERIYKNFRIIYFISEKENTIFIRYIFNARQDKRIFFDLHINSF